MASNVLRPGLHPGLGELLQEGFNVPLTPVIGVDEAARRVREKNAADRIPCGRLDISDVPVQRGALFDMSGARVTFPEGDAYDVCYVALIDPEPDAQWSHCAFWAFVPVDGQADVVVRPTEFPENAMGSVRLYRAPSS